MDADMYDEDGDEVMEQENKKKDNKPRRGSRLSDQVEMDDEPALVGYERYVTREASMWILPGSTLAVIITTWTWWQHSHDYCALFISHNAEPK
jgi:hypothetical protein